MTITEQNINGLEAHNRCIKLITGHSRETNKAMEKMIQYRTNNKLKIIMIS